MTYAQQLYQLQQIDSQIDAARHRLKEIEANLVESAALKSARAELAQAEQTLNTCKAVMTDLDLEVKSLQQKTGRHEERL